MDKLQVVAKIAYRRAKDKVQNGEVPTFLGTDGLVALMYERLIAYGKSKKKGEDSEEAIIDLAADALIVLHSVVPMFDEDSVELDETQPDAEVDYTGEPPIETDDNSGRWAQVKPGEDIKLPEEEEDE